MKSLFLCGMLLSVMLCSCGRATRRETYLQTINASNGMYVELWQTSSAAFDKNLFHYFATDSTSCYALVESVSSLDSVRCSYDGRTFEFLIYRIDSKGNEQMLRRTIMGKKALEKSSYWYRHLY